MGLQLKMISDSLVKMILKNKQQYITNSYIHLECYLHIIIHGQIILNNIYKYLEKTSTIRKNIRREKSQIATHTLINNKSAGPELIKMTF